MLSKATGNSKCQVALWDGMWHNVAQCIGMLYSLAPRRIQRNFREVIFQLILVIDSWSFSCKIILKLMPMDLTDGKSTLVQVMAWCRQATSHYLSQCWPESLYPYGIIRPQWVKPKPRTERSNTVMIYIYIHWFVYLKHTIIFHNWISRLPWVTTSGSPVKRFNHGTISYPIYILESHSLK